MALLQVFDRPMCCSTGVCGPSVDPALPTFAADLEWLKSQGVTVERFNLAQQPDAFASNAVVKQALAEKGEKCLPLLLLDGEIVSDGEYPSRDELAAFTGILGQEARSLYSRAVQELVAIGAAIAANCEVCLRHHLAEASKLDVSTEDVARAIATARTVKEAASSAILKVAGRHLAGERETRVRQPGACCPPGVVGPSRK